MKKVLLSALFLCTLALTGEEFITVYRDGHDFYVRSKYSESEDLIIHYWRFANEKSFLVKRGTPIKDLGKGKLLHASPDDYPAVPPLAGYGTISGNHGSYFTRRLTVPNHGFTDADKGQCLTEAKGYPYVILRILDKDNILIHPEGVPDRAAPRFKMHKGTPLFYKGKKVEFTSSILQQLHPGNRITRWELLADGITPIPDKKEIKCRFADFIFVHDVVNTYEVIQKFKKNIETKGMPEWKTQSYMCLVNTPELQKKYSEYMKLSAIATYSNKFRFQPRGACVNYRKITYHTALNGVVNNLDVMLAWNGLMARQKQQFFYIPKLKPLTITDRKTKAQKTIDLTQGIQLPIPMEFSYYIPLSDVIDTKDLPDRFIRVTGDGKTPLCGVALGYSLFLGKTAKSKMPGDRTTVYHLYKTNKMYPFSGSPQKVSAGHVEECVAYRQYFNPQLEPDATSFYCHYQGDSLMVYLDFHKELKNKNIKLPSAATGRKITVLEKTPMLTLHTREKVPAGGITLSNGAKHGYLVLKLD